MKSTQSAVTNVQHYVDALVLSNPDVSLKVKSHTQPTNTHRNVQEVASTPTISGTDSLNSTSVPKIKPSLTERSKKGKDKSTNVPSSIAKRLVNFQIHCLYTHN